jgi:hypothetical protein
MREETTNRVCLLKVEYPTTGSATNPHAQTERGAHLQVHFTNLVSNSGFYQGSSETDVQKACTYVSKIAIEDLDVAVYEFECDELIVLFAYLAYEEEGGVAAVYDLCASGIDEPGGRRDGRNVPSCLKNINSSVDMMTASVTNLCIRGNYTCAAVCSAPDSRRPGRSLPWLWRAA